jgi:hypothetical protein
MIPGVSGMSSRSSYKADSTAPESRADEQKLNGYRDEIAPGNEATTASVKFTPQRASY